MFSVSGKMTDSVGSRSDTSVYGPGGVTPTSGRLRMDAVCVIDLHRSEFINQRKKAFEEVRQACVAVNSNCHHVQVICIEVLSKQIVFTNHCINMQSIHTSHELFIEDWFHFNLISYQRNLYSKNVKQKKQISAHPTEYSGPPQTKYYLILLCSGNYVLIYLYLLKWLFVVLLYSLRSLILGKPQYWKHFTMLMWYWWIYQFKCSKVPYSIILECGRALGWKKIFYCTMTVILVLH